MAGGGEIGLEVFANRAVQEGGCRSAWAIDRRAGAKRALCIYSLERILALQEEGHPIFPGATGENLTLSGVDWDQVVPGARLKLGAEVVAEVLSYTEPCAAIKQYFAGGKIGRMLQDRNPGWSRVYAQVLEPGEIRVGDAVERIE